MRALDRFTAEVMQCERARAQARSISDLAAKSLWVQPVFPVCMDPALQALVDAVAAAPRWINYAKMHKRVLAGLAAKLCPIPVDVARIVADFLSLAVAEPE